MITSVTIPANVTEIYEKAFGYYYREGFGESKVKNFTVYGYSGSDAERYASDNNFKFVSLGSVTDNATGIIMDIPESCGSSVIVLTGQDAADAAKELPEGYKAKAVYDISVTDGGSAVQPGCNVKVQIPCTDENAKVFRKEADGSLTDMNAVYKDGYLVFTTNHFSVYVLVNVKKDSGMILGDADDDGQLTILDATTIQRHLAGLPTSAYNEGASDADGDGEVSILDATAIQRHLAGLPTNEAIGKTI